MRSLYALEGLSKEHQVNFIVYFVRDNTLAALHLESIGVRPKW
jgi:hypothetical protein